MSSSPLAAELEGPRAGLVAGSLIRRPNALNLVRLCLVLLVVFSHSFTSGRFQLAPLWLEHTPGQWALAGLFSISGFLIVSGRLRRGYVDFLARRLVRIWPLYAVCLVSIVVAFAPLDYFSEHGALDGYLTAPDGPISFFSTNILLELRQPVVSGTPDQFGWVGNLWTVFYTVLSYALLGAALGCSSPRRRFAAVAVLFVVSVVGTATRAVTEPYVQDARVYALLWCLAFFAGGAMLALAQRVIRPNVLVAAGALIAGIVVVGLWPEWGLQAAAPLIGYALLVFGSLFALPNWLANNDFAMGFFMFSVPVQQSMYHIGLSGPAGSPAGYFVLSVLLTLPFAVASWYFVEQPVLRRTRDGFASQPPPSPTD